MTHPQLESLPESVRQHVSAETCFFDLPDPFILESGKTLRGATIAYRTWGTLNKASGRATLICHALTASADADIWWPGMIGSGAAFDPADEFIVCSNLLGSCYGSTGPLSVETGSGKRYRADFPKISIRDMVNAQRLLIDHLGIKTLSLVTGPSLGGMQALEWAALYPNRVEAIAPIGVGGRHSAWCIAGSEAQRAAIYADANWQEGCYSDDARPVKGLGAARMMAICSYRSWQSFQERFGRDERDDGQFQMQSYLAYQAQQFCERFDANCYVRLTQAMNSHDLGRNRGSYFDVLESIRQPALVVSVSSDGLYPASEQEVLARHLPNASYKVLDTDDGHDGFLIKTGPLARLLRDFRQSLATGPLNAVA